MVLKNKPQQQQLDTTYYPPATPQETKLLKHVTFRIEK